MYFKQYISGGRMAICQILQAWKTYAVDGGQPVSHTVVMGDVVKILQPPDIQLFGSRIYFSFPGKFIH